MRWRVDVLCGSAGCTVDRRAGTWMGCCRPCTMSKSMVRVVLHTDCVHMHLPSWSTVPADAENALLLPGGYWCYVVGQESSLVLQVGSVGVGARRWVGGVCYQNGNLVDAFVGQDVVVVRE